jgi:tetratricopeptide (TPR) repeat protein
MEELDAQQINRRFEVTAARRGFNQGWYALVGFGLVLLLLQGWGEGGSGRPPILGILLSWLVVFGLLGAGWLRARRQRQARKTITLAWERVQLEQWAEAEEALNTAMRRPIQSDADRGQAFMVMATLAERRGRFDQAAYIYERLLLGRIGDGYQLQQTQLAIANAKLRNEELTDAVTLLDHLEKLSMPRALGAVYALIRLYQQVFMGHNEDAVAELSERRSLFRRFLSTRAGYGYGLLAAALHRLGRHDEAAQFWLDATTLIPAAKLVAEYGTLLVPCEGYPSMEHPG